MKTRQKYIRPISVLNGIFMLGIIIFHTSKEIYYPQFFDFLMTWGGYFGNYYFFIVSGFLFSLHYSCAIKNDELEFISFVINRMKRLLPLFLFSHVFLYFVIYLQYRTYPSLEEIFHIATLTTSGWITNINNVNTPACFISVDFFCYILAFIVVKMTAKNKDIYQIVVVFFIFWGRILQIYDWKVPFCYVGDGEGIFNFFLGMIICDFYIWLLDQDTVREYVSLFMMAGILVIAVYGMIYPYHDFLEACNGDPRYIVSIIVSMLLIAFFSSNWINRILSEKCRMLVKFGKISYEMCLLHIPAVYLFRIVKSWLINMNHDSFGTVLYFSLLFLLIALSKCFFDICYRVRKLFSL